MKIKLLLFFLTLISALGIANENKKNDFLQNIESKVEINTYLSNLEGNNEIYGNTTILGGIFQGIVSYKKDNHSINIGGYLTKDYKDKNITETKLIFYYEYKKFFESSYLRFISGIATNYTLQNPYYDFFFVNSFLIRNINGFILTYGSNYGVSEINFDYFGGNNLRHIEGRDKLRLFATNHYRILKINFGFDWLYQHIKDPNFFKKQNTNPITKKFSPIISDILAYRAYIGHKVSFFDINSYYELSFLGLAEKFRDDNIDPSENNFGLEAKININYDIFGVEFSFYKSLKKNFLRWYDSYKNVYSDSPFYRVDRYFKMDYFINTYENEDFSLKFIQTFYFWNAYFGHDYNIEQRLLITFKTNLF